MVRGGEPKGRRREECERKNLYLEQKCGETGRGEEQQGRTAG